MRRFTKDEIKDILRNWISDDIQLEYMAQGAMWMQMNNGCDACRQMMLDTQKHCMDYIVKTIKEQYEDGEGKG